MMSAANVLLVLECLQEAGVAVWVDGGWGIDALVGRQTRPHDDLDVVIALADASSATAALAGLGFVAVIDELPTRFVARDSRGRHIAFHTVIFRMEPPGAIRPRVLAVGAASQINPLGA
jgi:lincosamide nucleotidyltransferase A/C/D/E